jgi:threonine/homoserine/homoserine lactone efflux protein
MTWQALLAWCGLAAVLTVTPGVDMALVGRTALLRGRRPAVLNAAGISTGTMVWGAASAVGVAAVLAASATAYDGLRLLGAAYLVWLGVQAFRRGGHVALTDGPAARSRSSYGVGLATNLANPKIVVFYSTVMPGFISPGASVLMWSLVLAAIHALFGLVWLSTYAHVLDRARVVFERPRVRRLIDRATGTVLVALGVRLAVDRH